MKTSKVILILGLSILGWSCSKSGIETKTEGLPALTQGVTRTWIGPEYWTNPLMNWQLSNGRLECTHGGWVNELHSLTHQLKEEDGDFQMTVRLGLLDRTNVQSDKVIFAGFKFAALGHRNDYRSNVLHDIAGGHGEELLQELPVMAGITTDGRLMIGSEFSEQVLSHEQLKDATLGIEVSHSNNTAKVSLIVKTADGETSNLESELKRDSLTGNVALACHALGAPIRSRMDDSDFDHPTFWFSDWSVSGDKFSSNLEQTYDPILWTQYTVQDKVLKLMAFLVPMEADASKVAELQVKTGSNWTTVAESTIEPLSLTATFRVADWDNSKDQEYRVIYPWTSANGADLATWGGIIRKDPKDEDSLVLAGLSCSNSELFPNRFMEANILAQDPDLVFFAGDQIYEPNGGYGIVFAGTEEDLPRAALNYLGKFWYTGLSFRELMKDRPTIMIPDDHDVYSNDLWGKEGVRMPGDQEENTMRCFGGYRMHPTWVNMVEHTQMGHHPDAYDPTPVERGIGVHYTSLDVGGVSFAIINDRKFKSAPGDVIDKMEPLFEIRGSRNLPKLDTINEENFDTTTLDDENLTFLGERQLNFLRDWGKGEAKLKAVLSQSAYCQPHHLMVADFDSNGWPQSGRKRALRVVRDANAVMINGDLHFPTLVQQGIDDWEDAGWSYTLPAVSTLTHRAWRPKVDGENRQPGMPDYTGRFLDGWGNKITIWAAANPHSFLIEDDYQGEGKATLDYMRNGSLGYGIVRFNKTDESVTFESWPVFGQFKGVGDHEQHPGFPKTVSMR
ncbi:MAG: alkaline phosphatase D family protein [Verrucomicrobia bacterium]|nr:alkaline phosphatase D family protein [Verrucomicrobiota bacterium]